MSQYQHHRTWDPWSGWSTISADNDSSFTIWFTGLRGTGKKTLANLVKKALVARGYKVEIIDSQSLSFWLNRKLIPGDDIFEDISHVPGYSMFVTYVCVLLARNGIITFAVSASPYLEAREQARGQIRNFIEVYLHCPNDIRQQRVSQREQKLDMAVDIYEPPTKAELNIDTSLEPSERSALRIIDHIEQHGYIAPLWEETEIADEEIEIVKARLQSLGYLE